MNGNDIIKGGESDIEGQTGRKDRIISEIFDWVESVVFSLVVLVVIFNFVFRIVMVDGPSMMQTLQNGDQIVLSTLFYNVEQGDIVVVSKPAEQYDKPIVKRVIATEGQTVDINFETGVVSVDGTELVEPYVNTPTNLRYDIEFPVVVDEGCYFVMGDNRNDSLDSRSSTIGMVRRDEIDGEVVFRLTPLSGIGVIH